LKRGNFHLLEEQVNHLVGDARVTGQVTKMGADHKLLGFSELAISLGNEEQDPEGVAVLVLERIPSVLWGVCVKPIEMRPEVPDTK